MGVESSEALSQELGVYEVRYPSQLNHNTTFASIIEPAG